MKIAVEQKERFPGSIGMGGDGSRHQTQGPRPFVQVSCPTALAKIHLAGTDLAIWQRRIGDDVAAELAELMLNEVDDLAVASAVNALDITLADAMTDAGYPAMPVFQGDILMLARQHAALVGDDDVRIRLEVIETDACRKFHADYVKARTITTYLGQGTQWIEAATPDDANAVRQLDAGDVAMFKGRLWQEVPAILHRSPPIGGRREQRLVLVVDPASPH